MEQCSVRAQGRTNCDNGEIKLFDRTSRSSGCDRGLLPFEVRVANEIAGSEETDRNNEAPGTFSQKGLKMMPYIAFDSRILYTEMYLSSTNDLYW